MHPTIDDLPAEEFGNRDWPYVAPVWATPMTEVSQNLFAVENNIGSSSEDDEGVEPQYIRGKVLSFDGLPVARTVVAVRRSDGQRMASTQSGEDGWFTLRPKTTEPVALIAIPLDEEKINAVVLDNILPVPD